ncbi:MAG TPA: hypothetical protein DCQ53_06185 [Alphaproteobacteria bacterium]|nr:hypothetical protein [Alphaproteobacteria bacterium]
MLFTIPFSIAVNRFLNLVITLIGIDPGPVEQSPVGRVVTVEASCGDQFADCFSRLAPVTQFRHAALDPALLIT